MCSAVRRRMLENGTTSSRPVAETAGAGAGAAARDGAAGSGAGAAGLGAGAGVGPRPLITASTSARVIRPPAPVPVIVDASSPFSAISRRTTGESSRVSPLELAGCGCSAAGAGAGAGEGGADRSPSLAAGAGAAAGAGSGCGSGAGDGAGAGSAAGAGAGAGAAPESPMRARTVPTSTVSPSGTRISFNTPATGEGTSESTLSVETSNSTSSSLMLSPTFLNQRVMVPSVTVSPSWGIVMSAIGGGESFLDLAVQGATGHGEHGLAEELGESRVRLDEGGDLVDRGLPV